MGGFLRVSRVRVGATDDIHQPGGSTTQHLASEDATEQAVLRSALAVLIQRAGGSIEYTEREFQAVHQRNGAYRIVGDIVNSGPSEPRIQLRITPTATEPRTLPEG